MGMPGKVLSVVCGVVLLAAAPASAATRYASVGGDASNPLCPQADPCDIQTAVEGGAVMAGDVVNVLPGTYVVGGDPVTASVRLTVQGAPGQPRPLIQSTAANALRAFADDSVVQDLRLETSGLGGGATLHIQADLLAQRLEIVASAGTAWGTIVQWGALLRDSVVRNSSDFGAAIVTAPPGGDIRNVTAIATGMNSDAIFTDTVSYGSPQDVTIRNVIARGTDEGIEIVDGDATDGNQDVDYFVSYTNYSSISEDPPDADIVLGAGNQTTAPLFANAAMGDFHQLAGSMTRDAGMADPLVGPLDFEGEPRSMGPATDIGADEFFVPTPPAPPTRCAGRNATRVGTGARDVINGTRGRDVIAALGGNDVVRGLGGNDVICGGKGKDRLVGGRGRDRLVGGPGADRLLGGPGRDVLLGGPGRDVLLGGPARDVLRGGPGRDRQRQ